MNANPPLPSALLQELKGVTRQKPLAWSVFMEKFVGTREYTEAQLVAAMNSIVLPFGNVSGNTRGFWSGLPES